MQIGTATGFRNLAFHGSNPWRGTTVFICFSLTRLRDMVGPQPSTAQNKTYF